MHLFAVIVTLLLIVCGYYKVSWPYALPAHLVSSEHRSDQFEPGNQICMAYEALFELDKKNHTSPPDLYALAEAKPIPEDANNQAKAGYVGRLMAALHKKTQKHYDDVKSLPDGSAMDSKRQLIRVWTKIGLVLIKEDIREVYNREIKGNLVKGLHNVCGQRWKKMKLDREL